MWRALWGAAPLRLKLAIGPHLRPADLGCESTAAWPRPMWEARGLAKRVGVAAAAAVGPSAPVGERRALAAAALSSLLALPQGWPVAEPLRALGGRTMSVSAADAARWRSCVRGSGIGVAAATALGSRSRT